MKKELREDLQFTGLFTVALAIIIGGVILLSDLMTSQMAANGINMQIAEANVQAQQFDKQGQAQVKKRQLHHKSIA